MNIILICLSILGSALLLTYLGSCSSYFEKFFNYSVGIGTLLALVEAIKATKLNKQATDESKVSANINKARSNIEFVFHMLESAIDSVFYDARESLIKGKTAIYYIQAGNPSSPLIGNTYNTIRIRDYVVLFEESLEPLKNDLETLDDKSRRFYLAMIKREYEFIKNVVMPIIKPISQGGGGYIGEKQNAAQQANKEIEKCVSTYSRLFPDA